MPPRRNGGSRPWRRTTTRIVRRDAGICHLCGQPGATTADHLVPVSLGGTDHPDNLRAAHLDCNRRRGNRSVGIAKAELTQRSHPTTDTWAW